MDYRKHTMATELDVIFLHWASKNWKNLGEIEQNVI